MRVLLIGPEWDTGQWTAYCAAGLAAGGHQVVSVLYGRDLARPVGLRGRLRRRLSGPHRFHIGRVLEAMRRDNLGALNAARRQRPDLTVVLKGEVLLPETVERLRDLTAGPVVQWCGDDPSWFPHIVAAAHLYDRFFLGVFRAQGCAQVRVIVQAYEGHQPAHPLLERPKSGQHAVLTGWRTGIQPTVDNGRLG